MINDSLRGATPSSAWYGRLAATFAAHPQLPRLSRFAAAGASAAVAQLLAVMLLLHAHVEAHAANGIAFLAAAQLNFAVNRWFTWRDRLGARSLGATWVRFMAAVSVTALFNLAAFSLAHEFVRALAATVAGIALVAVINFIVADRAVFAAPGHSRISIPAARAARKGP
jgi:putative flippase GtrA